MRLVLLGLLLPSLAAAEPVIALLPPQASTPELAGLGLLIEARAAKLLEGTGRYRQLHLKQVLAMAEQEGLDPAKLSDDAVGEQARVLLGADRVISLRLMSKGDGLALQGSVRGATAAPFDLALPAAWPLALEQGSEGLAKAVLAQDKLELAAAAKAQPESSSEPALKALASCWETALRQSMGSEAPVTLEPRELKAAIGACRAAVKADPTLTFGSAALALLLTIDRDDGGAKRLLDKAGGLAPATLARLWLLRRGQSHAAAVTFLEQAIARQPLQLLLRAYLAETLASSNQHEKAVAAWADYLALAPRSAYAHGRKSRSLAKLGKLEPALAAAKDGLALAPTSREALVQLASRQIDAKKPADALKTLVPLADLADPPAEGLLRLGWAYWLLDDVESARELFQIASERAKGPMAWRTKGRALHNLSLVELKAGNTEAAKALVKRSRETGYVAQSSEPALAAPAGKTTRQAGAIYLALAKVENPQGALDAARLAQATALQREAVGKLGVVLAPEGESREAALGVIKAQRLKAYQLSLRFTRGAEPDSLKVDAMVSTYPENALRGMWGTTVSGGEPEELVAALVPSVVRDLAGDLDW
jgi:tetratricopeptide (TPR) repeat protein